MSRLKFGWCHVEYDGEYQRKNRVFYERKVGVKLMFGWFPDSRHEIGTRLGLAPRGFAIFIKVLKFYIQIQGQWSEPNELGADPIYTAKHYAENKRWRGEA